MVRRRMDAFHSLVWPNIWFDSSKCRSPSSLINQPDQPSFSYFTFCGAFIVHRNERVSFESVRKLALNPHFGSSVRRFLSVTRWSWPVLFRCAQIRQFESFNRTFKFINYAFIRITHTHTSKYMSFHACHHGQAWSFVCTHQYFTKSHVKSRLISRSNRSLFTFSITFFFCFSHPNNRIIEAKKKNIPFT